MCKLDSRKRKRSPNQKMIPDWVSQLTWFVAGIFATGAFWYFLAQHNKLLSLGTGVIAIIFVILAIAFLRINDNRRRRIVGQEEDVVFEVNGEVIRFTELMRSVQHDVVIVHAYTHILGVAAEYEWIRRRYPNSELISQALTTLTLITGKKKKKRKPIHFDILTIRLEDGREKQIYFDISSFFGGGASPNLDPNVAITQRIAELYKSS